MTIILDSDLDSLLLQSHLRLHLKSYVEQSHFRPSQMSPTVYNSCQE
jgi:hypothetical protein